MDILEIILLAVGGIAFVSSFFLPDKSKSEAVEIPEEELKRLVEEELEKNRSLIEDMTEESVSHQVEKTERSLDRMTNEKIMALGEYSDNVLNQIGSNHQEVVFLHDMLNRSKNELEDLLNRIDRESREASERANAAYDLAENADKLAREVKLKAEDAGRAALAAEEKMLDARRLTQEMAAPERIPEDEAADDPVQEAVFDDVTEAIPDEMPEDNAGDVSFEEKAIEELAAGAAGDAVNDGAASEEELQALLDNAMKAEAAPAPVHYDKDPNEEDPKEEEFFEAEQEKEAGKEADEEDELSEEEMMEKLLKEATAELAHDVSRVSAASTKNVRKDTADKEKEAVRTSVKRRVQPKTVRKTANVDEIEGQMSIPDEFMPDNDKSIKAPHTDEKKDKKKTVNLQFGHENSGQTNHNERILEMHRMGRSNMAIAKDLGLGIGEVKLVIDLFENMQ